MATRKFKNMTRVIVMAGLDTPALPSEGRQTPAQRKNAIDAVVESVGRVLPGIDEVLERFGGRRLTRKPSALGHIVVETTREGIQALEALDGVAAVMEDHAFSPIR